ncbi:aromatic ring-hydroxylating dioxygenase subunit alpha [Hydrogenophaga sp. SNF1]|uniref:aromatic ring-hydroxylating dioxygenase subunit alpha n=1 Tax=Hydrogenophaga sp. SNF1 TaxID=3098762 RepID=UPI002ACC335E|nr:aromatic ring-hydroxylating dioxygenase subunit alpha [Hydrogenophaga sp. SNF1]WQB83053.1 aromatic ring-hydroxylating dioxygenase subunit alpha [Hydrogenophaga sp. SNF1]
MAHKDGIFLMNCWYVAAWSHDLIDGRKLARTLLEVPVVLYRGDSGRVVALDNRCCHRAAPLDLGRIEGDCLRCMYHGMKFDPSGKCIEIPGQERVPPKLGVRSYPVVERDGIVWIWMGDEDQADPAKIVDFPAMRDPAWRGIPDYMHYDANWMLIVDNLSDFAHLAFVHTNTLGGSEEYAYKTKPVAIERLEDGFRVERWHLDSDPPPYHRKVIPNKTDKVDRKNIGHMQIPGMFFLYTTFAPAGSGLKDGNKEGARSYCNCQFMTPETRRSTHFFWNYLHDFDLDDPNIARSLRNSIEEGFMEDKAFIEGQQKLLDADPEFKMLAIGADAALSHFRWVFDERVKAEQQAAKSAAQPMAMPVSQRATA